MSGLYPQWSRPVDSIMSKRPRDHSHIERRSVSPPTRAPKAKDPRKLTIDVVAKTTAPHQSDRPPSTKQPSKLPLIVFALIALVGLGGSSAALMIHVMTGGRQTEFSQEVLAQSLVAVDPDAGGTPSEVGVATGTDGQTADDGVDLSTPNIIPTRGDPIIVSRQTAVSRQLLKLDAERAKPAAALNIPGDVFSLRDNLGTVSASFAAGVPGSQAGFAFAQADAGDQEDDQPAAPDMSGAENATVLKVNNQDDSEAQSSRIVLARQAEGDTTVAGVLTSGGFDADMAKRLDTEVKQQLGVAKIDKSFGVAAVGTASSGDGGGYLPVQLALFKGGEFLGALAITETDSYVQAANPWFDRSPFRDEDLTAAGGTQRLLDVIYAAAVRNKLPTTVAGEIMMLLSRAHDLEQPSAGGETMQVLYTSKARDKKSGLGRILYVRIDRGSDDPIECFAFQIQPRKPFDCISGDGDGATSGGMTMPIRGVTEHKFGPGKDPVTGKKRMFYGVEWKAPPGTPVVAAFAGQVVFAGHDGKYGTAVKLSHGNGQLTVYSKLKTISDGIVEGATLRAGQRLGTVGLTDGSVDARLYFELQRGGQPVDPFGEYQSRIEKGGAVETLVNQITRVESGHDCKAKNPLSSAAGLGQFIESTWLRIIADYRPELVAGKSRAAILDLRYDCDIALEMTTNLTRENANYIRARGQPVTPGNLYLAHFLGPGGAAQALGSSPGASVLSTFGAGVVKANPFLKDFTNSDLIAWAARKMAGKGKAPVIATSTPGAAKAQSLASNKDFTRFKEAVLAMLN